MYGNFWSDFNLILSCFTIIYRNLELVFKMIVVLYSMKMLSKLKTCEQYILTLFNLPLTKLTGLEFSEHIDAILAQHYPANMNLSLSNIQLVKNKCVRELQQIYNSMECGVFWCI
ncbi:Hypothetical_protein [Hexamita inflata]|uniref:Hypothetical_protein n=1 Tax=Hexamita inflata TaxID=28002 RepID=A0AA86N684_9EUKA|nr:Hypothetical protein HINF_LOCUS1178 [Hexamita inflata]